MPKFDAQAIAEIVAMTQELFTDAGFTGVKLERAPMSDAVIESFRQEEPDEEFDPVAFGEEVHYHRVTTDQGCFGIWFEPYVTLDLYGTGLDLKEILPEEADTDGMPDGWSLIGLDQETPERLLAAFVKKRRQP